MTKPLKAKRVHIKDRQPICDCIIYIYGGFVIVGTDENDTAPTWYNVDAVTMIEGVETMHTQAGGRIGVI